MQKLHTSKLLLHIQANSSFSIFPSTLTVPDPSVPPEELVSTLPSAPVVQTVPPCCCPSVTTHTDLVLHGSASTIISSSGNSFSIWVETHINIAALLHFSYGKEFSPAVQQVIAAVDQETTRIPLNLLNKWVRVVVQRLFILFLSWEWFSGSYVTLTRNNGEKKKKKKRISRYTSKRFSYN